MTDDRGWGADHDVNTTRTHPGVDVYPPAPIPTEWCPTPTSPALLTVLHQHLPIEDVVRVATELIVRGVSPFTGTDLRAAITALLPHQVTHTDLHRVTQHLQTGGWTLGDTG